MTRKELLIKRLRGRKHHVKVLKSQLAIAKESCEGAPDVLINAVGFAEGLVDGTEFLLTSQFDMTDEELEEVQG